MQVSSTSLDDPGDMKIKSAINLLLFSKSIKTSQPSIQLTKCSTDFDIIMHNNGGICTRCNIMFKSKISLLNHKCS